MKAFNAFATALAMAIAANAESYTSPNGRISLDFDGTEFVVKCDSQQALALADFGIGAGGNTLVEATEPISYVFDYQMPQGKKSHCANRANKIVMRFVDKENTLFDMEWMLADDGVAYRYVGKQSEEHSAYRIPEGMERYMQRFQLSYEGFYPRAATGEIKGRKWGYPALLHPADNVWVLITEADIERWHAASRLLNTDDIEIFRVTPGDNDKHYSGVWNTPWRVAIIGDLAQVVESTLVTDLSPAPDKQDYSWIKPGSAAWIYWAYNRGSKDFQIVKQYIDMAAALNLPYVLIDWEWDVMENGGDINDAIAYADSLGVRTHVWYNSSTNWTTDGAGGPLFRLNKPADREKEFAWLEDMGIAGVKIDFFDGDSQEMMEYYIDLLESAARHHLLVNFHGATIPRGWQRTYPNFMSAEAVYGAEWYNNKPVLTDRAAAHNATLPFTRNVIGPMDYTPCTFSDSQHKHITSNAHELALPVLFESALLHWADKPESYLAQPAEVHELMRILPTTWDETRLLGGYPADYVVMARRKGDTWFVAGINGTDEARVIDIDWSRIGSPQGYMQLFQDSLVAPWEITNPSELPARIALQPRGGFVLVIE